MEFTEADEQGKEREQQPDAGHQGRELAVEAQVDSMT